MGHSVSCKKIQAQCPFPQAQNFTASPRALTPPTGVALPCSFCAMRIPSSSCVTSTLSAYGAVFPVTATPGGTDNIYRPSNNIVDVSLGVGGAGHIYDYRFAFGCLLSLSTALIRFVNDSTVPCCCQPYGPYRPTCAASTIDGDVAAFYEINKAI